MQEIERAFARAWAKTGKRIAARMAMIAMTTSNSIRVNARLARENMTSFTFLRRVRACGALASAGDVLTSCRAEINGPLIAGEDLLNQIMRPFAGKSLLWRVSGNT